jgi:hypothetical protein
MRVDNPDQGPHDHSFGSGAHQPEPHEIGLIGDQLSHEASAGSEHGLFDSMGHGADAHSGALGGHVEIGVLGHDFGHDGLHDGLDGLHDSVHHSLGLGFEGDTHHSLHEGLHESLHAGLHEPQHELVADVHHDPAHDVQHHDTGFGDFLHH